MGQWEVNKVTNKVIVHYCELYKKSFGVNPLISPKGGGIVKQLLKSLSEDEVNAVISFYFSKESEKERNKLSPSADISVLLSSSVINNIRSKMPKFISKEDKIAKAKKRQEFYKKNGYYEIEY